MSSSRMQGVTNRSDQMNRRPDPRLRSAVEALEARQLLSVTFDIRYDYDNGFFTDPNRKNVLQAAADALGARLNDTLAAIPAASGSNTWIANFPNPSTGALTSLTNLEIAQNTIVIYTGSRSLGGSELGRASSGSSSSGDSAWRAAVQGRGQTGAVASPPTDTAPWGGAIAFDSNFANWYFATDPSGITSGQTDFFSVAQHEIGHLLGIVDSGNTGVDNPAVGAWEAQISGGNFTGSASTALYGGPVPIEPGNIGHWKNGTQYKGGPLTMDPSVDSGRRTQFTDLDFAGLQDVGWQIGNAVAQPVPEPGKAASYSYLGSV